MRRHVFGRRGRDRRCFLGERAAEEEEGGKAQIMEKREQLKKEKDKEVWRGGRISLEQARRCRLGPPLLHSVGNSIHKITYNIIHLIFARRNV